MNIQNLKQRFSKQQLFSFFLTCAFPFHLWTLIMLIRDYGWITQRSGTSSFTGVASLAMIYALVESLIFFFLLLILGLLIPWNWPSKRVFTLSGFLALWIPIWDMLSQSYRAANFANPGFFIIWLFGTQHPIRYGYPILILIIILTVGLTAGLIWAISFNQKVRNFFHSLLDRIMVLSVLYLVLDVVAVVIAAVRIIGI
jgi:hypothetical protein